MMARLAMGKSSFPGSTSQFNKQASITEQQICSNKVNTGRLDRVCHYSRALSITHELV